MRYILNWPIVDFSWTSFRKWPLASLLSSPGSIFQQCLAFAKVVSKRVESVLSGRSDALQRRLIFLPWNSHLIAPLSTSRWLCRFARTKHLFGFLSRACFDKWFHNFVIPHLPYELTGPRECIECVDVVGNGHSFATSKICPTDVHPTGVNPYRLLRLSYAKFKR